MRVNWSEDLYGKCGVESLVVGSRGAFTDDRAMLLHRGAVRVDLNDRYFGAVVVDVLVERDQLGLVLLDELDEARHPPAFGIQLAWLEPVGGNEDQRCAGRSWCGGWGARRDVCRCLVFAAGVVGIRGEGQVLPALVGGDLRLVGRSGDRECIRAEEQAQWGIVDLGDLQDGLRGLDRVTARRA